MTLTRLPLLLLAASAAACAGGGSSADQPFRDAAPTTSALAVQIDGAPATSAAAADATPTPLAAPTTLDACHPHLFLRTEALAARLNRHVAKALGRIEHVIARTPALSSGTQVQWDEVRDGVEVRFTMNRNGEVYTWQLDLRPAGGSDAQWAKVFWGDIDRTGAAGPHQGSGAFTVDLDAFHQAIPAETASGTLQATFDLTAAKRVLDVTAAGVTWDPDSDGDGLGHVSPLDASYHYVREPGRGGSLSGTDAMVFLCPSNPGLLPADVTLAARWYLATDGSVHGRSDAKATGGQLAPATTILGVTCHQGAADATDAERYWMMKLEDDATGTTLQSWAQAGDASACDPAFGLVPLADGASQDYDFTKPVTFPGEL